MLVSFSGSFFIYYLPGHGGRITNGLGKALVARGYKVVGRETVGDFKKLDFDDQGDCDFQFWLAHLSFMQFIVKTRN